MKREWSNSCFVLFVDCAGHAPSQLRAGKHIKPAAERPAGGEHAQGRGDAGRGERTRTHNRRIVLANRLAPTPQPVPSRFRPRIRSHPIQYLCSIPLIALYAPFSRLNCVPSTFRPKCNSAGVLLVVLAGRLIPHSAVCHHYVLEFLQGWEHSSAVNIVNAVDLPWPSRRGFASSFATLCYNVMMYYM